MIVASIYVVRGIRSGLPREWGVSAEKGLLWKEGVVFGAAPAVEALWLWGEHTGFGAAGLSWR